MKKITIQSTISILGFDELTEEYQQLITRAKTEVEKAYAPYSHFHVGAAVLLENGEIFSGSNQENAAYPSGLCAERVALYYANAQRPNVASKVIAIAAYTNGTFTEEPISPCGACRQVMIESEMRFKTDMAILLYGSKHIYLIENTKQLLPMSFTFK